MPVIDFRIRPPFGEYLQMVMYSRPERRDRFTRQLGFEPAPSVVQRSPDLMLAEMDEAGIDVGVVIGRHAGFFGSVSNETVMEFVNRYPGRFLGVASIDVSDRKAAVATIEAAMKAGFVAINIEPTAAPVPMQTDDRRMYPIYAFCEDNNIPIILMTGGNAGPDLGYTVPVALDRVLADFPSLKVVSSHGNWPWVHEVLHIAYRRENLYLSPDMYLVEMPGMVDYLKAADTFLADRFIYASSYPLCPVKGYYEWFSRLPLRTESKERILYKNALEFLGLDRLPARPAVTAGEGTAGRGNGQ